MSSGARAVVRGCGTRTAGGIYAECGTSPFGQPVEFFLIDPPVRYSVMNIEIAAVGVKLLSRGGVSHIFDWVGAEHYENVVDFIEEVRRFGLSRRLPITTEFEYLTPDSRLVTMHERAYVHNWQDLLRRVETIPQCPKAKHGVPWEQFCAGFWWYDVSGAFLDNDEPHGAFALRRMPSFDYVVRPPIDGPREYEAGAFARWPISRLVVVRDPDSDSDAQAMEKAEVADLPVEFVDE